MLRKIIIFLLAAAIIAGGYFGYRKLSTRAEESRPAPPSIVKSVYAETVVNSAIPLEIVASGKLVATRRVTLTSEVTGLLKASRFKEGVPYSSGEVIFTISNSEITANLVSLRSIFYSKLLAIMPDLKLDYPDVWPKWDAYLKSIDIHSNIPPLPEFTTEREKNFVTGNDIIYNFQVCKNLEVRAGKFVIRAPFNGVITKANVQEGGLVTQGQPLGEISSLGDYELELPVSISLLEYLKVGRKMELSPIEGSGTYTGEIVRINPSADVGSQSITAYVRVLSGQLREGMYLKAVIDAGTIENAYEIDRKLISSQQEVYIVGPDSLLSRQKIEPVYFKEETAIVKGLADGTVIVSKPLPGAYPGLQVKILEEEAGSESSGS